MACGTKDLGILTYDILEISDGQMASSAWVCIVEPEDDKETAMIRK